MKMIGNNYNDDIFINSFPNILENTDLREPQRYAYTALYNHFITEGKRSHALIVLPTGERVIIVTGYINALVSRVSGTLVRYKSCTA